MLVDIHAHLDNKQFDRDINNVVARAKKNNVVAIINNGLDKESNRKTLWLSKKYDIVKPAFGFHPTSKKEELDFEFIKKNKPIAIGEVGLDYFYLRNKEEQKLIFKRFISLAKELNLPIIVHSRKAEKDVVDILEESEIKKVVLHSFNGNKKLIAKAERLGYYFSIPTKILISKHYQYLVDQVSISKLLTETDSPYQATTEKRNEPSFVKEVIKKISEIKNLTEEGTEKNIFLNFQKLFKNN